MALNWLQSAPSLDELADRARQEFSRRFGRAAQFVVAAPGRVNLIGEHVDYNGGVVLPMAIDRYTVIAADRAMTADRPRGEDPPLVRLYSAALADSDQFAADHSLARRDGGWSNYVRGVVAGCVRRGMAPGGFDAVIDSSVPVGSGLSSSAALEVASATLVEALSGKQLDPAEKALLCQQAEHEFAGVPCGIMDQFASVMGRRDHLLLLDCHSRETTQVPLDDDEVTVLIINSNVQHSLTGGEYAQRRAHCHEAAELLGVPDLGRVSLADLHSAESSLSPVLLRRARHVVREIDRTRAAAAAIARGDWPAVGALMYQSHASLRDDFQVSCDQLDVLVELAESLGPRGGVIGSRMTGGGFGGCTVSLVRTDAASAVAESIGEGYQRRTGLVPAVFATRPAQGAKILAAAAG